MARDTTSILRRLEELLNLRLPEGDVQGIYSITAEALQGAVTVAEMLYGRESESRQVHTMLKAAQQARENKSRAVEFTFYEAVWPVVQGSLRAMKSDVESGLIGSIERRAAGEVLGDMLGLAKDALGGNTEDSKNVAAVLTAAAYEDAIRRMGASLASVQGRPKLAQVLEALKNGKVLQGASFTVAQSYLKFRNDALHADWAQIDRPTVASCIGLVEQLLMAHLS